MTFGTNSFQLLAEHVSVSKNFSYMHAGVMSNESASLIDWAGSCQDVTGSGQEPIMSLLEQGRVCIKPTFNLFCAAHLLHRERKIFDKLTCVSFFELWKPEQNEAPSVQVWPKSMKPFAGFRSWRLTFRFWVRRSACPLISPSTQTAAWTRSLWSGGTCMSCQHCDPCLWLSSKFWR